MNKITVSAVLILTIILSVSAQAENKEKKNSRSDLTRRGTFPMIANCYNSRIGIGAPVDRINFVSQYGLCIGGFWQGNTTDPAKIKQFQATLLELKKRNPKIILLDFSTSAPYVLKDVAEKFNFPKDGYLITPDGNRINGWPGTEMIDLSQDKVIEWLASKVENSLQYGFDGVFIDCMGPSFDGWACEIATGKPWSVDLDHDGKADDIQKLNKIWDEAKTKLAKEVRRRIGPNKIFMANQAGEDTFPYMNGILFEDNLDYVLDQGADWRSIIVNYIHWTKTPCKPNVTTIVSSSGVEPPFELWKLPEAEQDKFFEKGRVLYNRMRFGLATTLVGDGYFAYDLHTRARGQHWWYPEYDADLGLPKSDAVENKDGTWQREFDKGTVVVNPTIYDARFTFRRRYEDASSEAVANEFVVPSMDGRIFTYSVKPPHEGKIPDPVPLFTRNGPETVVERDGKILFRLDNDWRTLFKSDGVMTTLDIGKAFLATGISPAIIDSKDNWRDMPVMSSTHKSNDNGIEFQVTRGRDKADIVYDLKVERVAKGLKLTYDITAKTDVYVRVIRIPLDFSCEIFKEGRAIAPDQNVLLPVEKKSSAWMADDFTTMLVHNKDESIRMRIDTSRNAILRDERVYGGNSYKLSVEIPGGDIKAGTKWRMEIKLTEEPK